MSIVYVCVEVWSDERGGHTALIRASDGRFWRGRRFAALAGAYFDAKLALVDMGLDDHIEPNYRKGVAPRD